MQHGMGVILDLVLHELIHFFAQICTKSNFRISASGDLNRKIALPVTPDIY